MQTKGEGGESRPRGPAEIQRERRERERRERERRERRREKEREGEIRLLVVGHVQCSFMSYVVGLAIANE